MQQGSDPYMKGFVGALFLRPSCHACPFTGVSRCSDLTLGDCWGIWKSHQEFDDNRGTSLVFVHGESGGKLWNSIKDGLSYIELNHRYVEDESFSAVFCCTPNPKRKLFFERFASGEPVGELIMKLMHPPKTQSKAGSNGFLGESCSACEKDAR